ncbi:peptidase inhibitor family I36 protein [Kitasatospora sp. NPDC093558]|uniref:peptidase inhibitor family I36 protein n=1 Tax=Kitasatospora sp. NPDC093558 TaxID=3155201 RepID=UPI00342A1D2B
MTVPTTVPTTGRRGARLAKAALALAGAAALTCGTAVAAEAPPGNPPGVHILNGDSKNSKAVPCPAGWVCVYDGWYDYGAIAVLPGTEVGDLTRVRLTDGATLTGDQKVSGWINNSPVRYCWYEKGAFQGTSHEMTPFGKDSKFSGFNSFKPC